MALKDLFFIPKEDGVKKEPSKNTTKFPNEIKMDDDIFPSNSSEKNVFSKPPQNVGKSSDEHITKFREMYTNGFNSLNQDGFDFYDFYQSVMQVGVDNPQTYTMAMAMGLAMNKAITKDALISQGQYCLAEINKVHAKQSGSGGSRRQEISNQKEHDNNSLLNKITELKSQIEQLQQQIKQNETEVSNIANKYEPLISEIDSKLVANDLAKNEIVTTIEKVINGINKNLK